MTGQLSAAGIIFRDDFSVNGLLDGNRWHFNEWQQHDNPSYYGRTQQRQVLPEAQDGVARLRLDSYNPGGNHDSFYGSEAITHQKFDLSNGPIAFEAKFRFDQDQRGIIGGFFTYALPRDTHDEIDYEAISNNINAIQTNIYANEGLWEGSPQSHELTGSLLDYHTYRIEWLPNAVRWLVDGQVVRVETSKVPTKPQEIHLNIWAPPADWATGDAGIAPASSPADNRVFYLDVDYVQVELLNQIQASGLHETLVGTSASEYIAGGDGDDTLVGHGGSDFLDGGDGKDTVVYAVASHRFAVSVEAGSEVAQVLDHSGEQGADTLLGIETIAFDDRSLDLASLIRAGGQPAENFVPLVDLYVAYLDRAPDSVGLAYWAGELADGATVADVAHRFFHSTEAADARGEGVSAAALVDNAYAEILDRTPDDLGRAYWIESLESGELGFDSFPLAFVLAARSAAGSSDAQAVTQKARVAAYYALDHGLNGAEQARAVIDADSEQQARDLIDAHVASLAASVGSGENGELVTRLTGIEFGTYADTALYGVSIWG